MYIPTGEANISISIVKLITVVHFMYTILYPYAIYRDQLSSQHTDHAPCRFFPLSPIRLTTYSINTMPRQMRRRQPQSKLSYVGPAARRVALYGTAGAQLARDVAYLGSIINSELKTHHVQSANNYDFNGYPYRS